MSSRNQKITESPVSRWYKWKTLYDENENIKGGSLVWYDKENKKNVEVDLPFSFALINDNCVTFSGFSEGKGQGVWANEGYDKNHEIVLKTKDETLLKFKLGDYKANKDKIEGFGAKYTKVLYCAVPLEDGGFELIGITLAGSGLTGGVDKDNFEESEKYDGYFNYTKTVGKSKLMSNFITISEFRTKKKGKTKYAVPHFEMGQVISEDENTQLMELNKALDDYHAYYYSKPKEAVEQPVSQEEDFTS